MSERQCMIRDIETPTHHSLEDKKENKGEGSKDKLASLQAEWKRGQQQSMQKYQDRSGKEIPNLVFKKRIQKFTHSHGKSGRIKRQLLTGANDDMGENTED